ncbi:MAG: hypothetical protein LBE12_12110 [Planctomycetaceae bacterium]|nr:hypothetical protein [Planctomycetaceae bacterium]
MPQADYYQNGNNSACDTIHSPLSTLHYYFALSGRWGGKGNLNPPRWGGL